MLMYSLFSCSIVFLFKQKTAYEMRISDWSSDVCSSDQQCVRVGDAKLDRTVDDADQVEIIIARIGLVDLVRKGRAIAGRTARVGREHGIAGGGVELVVGREMRAIGRERPALDFEAQRHPLDLDMAGRQRQPDIGS